MLPKAEPEKRCDAKYALRRLLEMLDEVCIIHAYLSTFNRKMLHVKK
jgi:hypothetical protein